MDEIVKQICAQIDANIIALEPRFVDSERVAALREIVAFCERAIADMTDGEDE